MKIFYFINYKTVLLLFLIFFFDNLCAIPKLTVVMVVDQFAQDYINKLRNNFNYAFKMLGEKGINYTNAHHMHGTPTTATGHNALNTGTLANKHGIVLNAWKKIAGKNVRYDQDDNPSCLSFGVNGTEKYGNSAKNIMVSGITDEFVKKSGRYKSFSLSYKSRAAIGMSGKAGHPIWFDEKTGIFTSSRAFFDNMPKWLSDFNSKNNIDKIIKNKKWELCYSNNSKYYNIEDINFNNDTNYKYARYDKSLISHNLLFKPINSINKKNKTKVGSYKFDVFLKSPMANKILLNLAEYCVKNNLGKEEKMLLWVSLSPLDKLGHSFGPQSIEVIDMIYHLDKQINDFYVFLANMVGEDNLLFILTADHGVEPVVELMRKKGNKAYRIQPGKLIREMNKKIEQKYNISNIVKMFKTSQFYLSKEKIKVLSKNLKIDILNDLKKIILSKKGVRSVWTYDELENLKCGLDSYESFYQKQLYPGRSGDIICMPERYSIFTEYNYGTGHRSAYEYNTNVPIIIYQKNRFENKTVDKKVWIPQLSVTLAKILELNKSVFSEFEPLTGIE